MPTTKQVQAALQAYFNIFGNYAVPATYVIDSKDERFPASMRGCALGKLVEDIHYRRQYTNMHATEIWQRMGLFEGTDKHEFTLFCEAMQAFVRKHKHTIVRQSYVVPADSPIYPKSTWNLPLGELYAKARRGVIWHYPPNYAQLLELGVIKNYYKNGVDLCPPLPSLSLLKQAIEVYHCLHNNYDIPSDFIFSEKIIKSYKKKSKNELDEKMKAQLIGLHLGEVMEDVQQGTLHNDVRARSYWSSLNISFSKPVLHRELQVGDANREKFNMVRDALQAYKSVYGNTHVSEDFVVPANSTDFPEHCLGFALGYSVFSIKRYGSWMREEFIEDLKATGVVNSYFPDDPCKKMPWWTEVESSLLTYQQQHGNLDVPATYVLEDSTLYPSEMIGYDLGLILQDIRAEKQYCNKKLSAKWRKMGILAPKEKPKK